MSHFQRYVGEQKCCQRGVSSTTLFAVFKYACRFPYFDFLEVEEALTNFMFLPVSVLSQNWENVLVKQVNISQGRLGLSCWLQLVENPSCSARDCLQCKRFWFNPWDGKVPWRRKWQPAAVFLPGKSHGQRSQADSCPWGLKIVGHDLATNAPPVLNYCWGNYQGNQGRCEELICDLTPLLPACIQNYWVPLSVDAGSPHHQTSHACEQELSNLLISEHEVFIIQALDRSAEWKAILSVLKEIVTIMCSSSWCK